MAEPGVSSRRRTVLDDLEAEALALEYEMRPAEDLVRFVLENYHPRVAIAFSGQVEDAVVLDIAYRINSEVRAFIIDTGRLPQEIYEYVDIVRDHYGIKIEVIFPDEKEVAEMVYRYGFNLFYKSVDLRLLCCHIRKVRPLQRYLANLDAWITGLRREQWASRVNVRKVEVDHDHGGILKVNPLADWTYEDVWKYVRERRVPYVSLYDKGYKSIGCAPCTRPVSPGEDPRAGRWWWERDAPKECGMHCSIYTGGFEKELATILKGGVRRVGD
ncbi:MAG: phosphoadenylyl-sulfate reductase [Nitrososphaerota archaeon]|nr:phosphoadenylyl-sulfate reductase [Candidatus Calditenuis fumarioli]